MCSEKNSVFTSGQRRCYVLSIVLTILGGLLIAVGVGFPFLVNYLIRVQLDISSPDAKGYQFWQTNIQQNSVPIDYSVYMFNITNPQEVINGAKPKLFEMKAATWGEYYDRFNVSWQNDGDVVQFWEQRFWTSKDKAMTDQIVTSWNLPSQILMGNAAWLEGFADDNFTFLYHTDTVENIFFGHWHPTSLPIDLPGYNQNQTSRLDAYVNIGPFKVYSGKNTVSRTREYLMWRGMTTMQCCEYAGPCNNGPLNSMWSTHHGAWGTHKANEIRGTFGNQFHPDLEEGGTLPFWIDVMFRSADLVNHKGQPDAVQYHHDIKSYRYKVPETLLEPESINPANAAYFMKYRGAFDLSRCESNTPVVVTKPYFLDGDKRFNDGVEFLNGHADRKKHDLWVDVEPKTGTTLEARERLQVNLNITTPPQLALHLNQSTMLWPVGWIERSGSIPDNLAHELRVAIAAPIITRVIGLAAGGVLFLIGLGIWIRMCVVRKRKLQEAPGKTGLLNPGGDYYEPYEFR